MTKTKVRGIRRVDTFKGLRLGLYDGVWGGHVVRFSIDGVEYQGQTVEGIRTPAAKCKVQIQDESVFVLL